MGSLPSHAVWGFTLISPLTTLAYMLEGVGLVLLQKHLINFKTGKSKLVSSTNKTLLDLQEKKNVINYFGEQAAEFGT